MHENFLKCKEKLRLFVTLGKSDYDCIKYMQLLPQYEALGEDYQNILFYWAKGYLAAARDSRNDTASKIGSLVGDCARYRAEIFKLNERILSLTELLGDNIAKLLD